MSEATIGRIPSLSLISRLGVVASISLLGLASTAHESARADAPSAATVASTLLPAEDMDLREQAAAQPVAQSAVLADPAPVASAAPVVPFLHRASGPAPALPPSGPRVLRLTSPDGRLDVPVGTYSDCSGQTALFTNAAAIDTCMRGVLYFVGHNPGVFAPLMGMDVGSRITWWDGSGVAHEWKILGVRTVPQAAGAPARLASHVVAQFQTCAVPDGSIDRILDAVSLNPDPNPAQVAVAPPVPAAVANAMPVPDPTPPPTPASYTSGGLLGWLFGGGRRH